MDESSVASLVRILLEGGRNSSRFVVKVLSIFLNPDWTPDETLRHCYAEGTWPEISCAFVAAVARNPSRSEDFLTAFQRLFRTDKESLPPITNHDFVPGGILGAFEAGVWLDENWTGKHPFHSFLLTAIPSFVWCGNGLLESADQHPLSAGYRSCLTDAIKKYIRKEGNGKGERLADIAGALEEVLKRWRPREANSPETKLPPLTEMILDGLTYGWFGGLSPIGRLYTVVAGIQELFGAFAAPAET